MEQRLERRVQEKNNGILSYPLPIPYGIAESTKGFGFYGDDENKAHNLPLPGNPHFDEHSRELFNEHVKPLYVSPDEMREALALLNTHEEQNRPLERDNPVANRHPETPVLPELHYRDDTCSTMAAIDRFFVDLVAANPDLRPRVGNPDELASNRLSGILKTLRHRVAEPENATEDVKGEIITVLNEEAVVSACHNLRFKPGVLRSVLKNARRGASELNLCRQQRNWSPGRLAGLAVSCYLHTWENGKNQQSTKTPPSVRPCWVK